MCSHKGPHLSACLQVRGVCCRGWLAVAEDGFTWVLEVPGDSQ
jgi:hypothetical protein